MIALLCETAAGTQGFDTLAALLLVATVSFFSGAATLAVLVRR